MTAQDHHRSTVASRLLIALALLAMTAVATAAEPVGRVISTTGTVTAVDADNESRAISRNDVVFPGETIRTAPRARAQIRFIDDALVALRPRTHFEIEDYAEDDDSGSAVMNLVQGALRAISGRIGNRAGDDYRMNTPTATVGIRGTDYSLQYCDADCAGDGRREGTYGRVNDGGVEVSNAFGSLDLDAGTYFFIPDDGPPEVLLTPPGGILDDVDEEEGEPADEDTAADGADPGPVTLVDADPTGEVDTGAEEFRSGEQTSEDDFTEVEREPEPEPDAFAGLAATGHAGRSGTSVEADGDTYLAPAEADVETDADGRFVRADMDVKGPFSHFPNLNASDMEEAEFGVSEIGGTEVRWGRWAGSFVVDGSVYDGGVVWGLVDSEDLATPAQLAELVGLFEFGNPDGALAVGDDGSVWSWDEFSMGFDFANPEGVFLNTLALSEQGGARTVAFSDESGEFATDARFVLFTSNDGPDLLLTGGFFGDQADGVLTTARIRMDGLEISGTQILENLTDPDDAELQEFELEGTLAYGLLGETTELEGGADFADRNVIDTASATVVVDSSGRLIRVVESTEVGDRTTEFEGMTHVDADSLDALEARWGRWTEGTVTRTLEGRDLADVEGDYMYAYSELDPTTPNQLGALEGTFLYEHAGGPMAVSDAGNEWSIDALAIEFGIFGSTIGSGEVLEFVLGEADGPASVVLSSESNPEMDLDGWNFTLDGNLLVEGDSVGGAGGQIDGRFIGVDAEGALYSFDVNIGEIESILGTGVLEQGDPVFIGE